MGRRRDGEGWRVMTGRWGGGEESGPTIDGAPTIATGASILTGAALGPDAPVGVRAAFDRHSDPLLTANAESASHPLAAIGHATPIAVAPVPFGPVLGGVGRRHRGVGWGAGEIARSIGQARRRRPVSAESRMARPPSGWHVGSMTSRPWDTVWLGASVATFDPARPGPWGALHDAAVGVKNGRIVWLGPLTELPERPDEVAAEVRSVPGCWITPGLIDCHTHAVFGGDRADEFAARLGGESYEAIARAGGGIRSTVSATRGATDDQLRAAAEARLRDLAREGVTTVEVKSGYDLTTDGEIRMLDVAHAAGRRAGVEIQGTLLGLHALPPEFEGDRAGYIELVAREMVPRAAAEGRARQVDAFVEGIAFTAAECAPVFEAARAAGLGLRVHADQLSDAGGAALAGRWGAASADHLERTSEEGVGALAAGGCVAVLLPGAYLTLRDDVPPPVTGFRQQGVPMAVASDLNPGSSPVRSLRTSASLACSLFGLTPAEALAGVTREAARALQLDDRGVLSVGRRADLAIWEVERLEELVYWIGGDLLLGRVVEGIEDAP